MRKSELQKCKMDQSKSKWGKYKMKQIKLKER